LCYNVIKMNGKSIDTQDMGQYKNFKPNIV
jgi:hypothetical protein